MKLDDRFMTILTALLLIVGVGALIQGNREGSSLFGASGNFEPKPDSFTLRAGRVQGLDVLLNDLSVDRINPAEIAIVQPPKCGIALATSGLIQYSDSQECNGSVVLSYCVPFEGDCLATPVTLTILNLENEGDRVASARPATADGAPRVTDDVLQVAGPQEQTSLVMRQPMRLTLPTDSEVVTPSEATEDIRRLGAESETALAANENTDSGFARSQTQARSGSVSVVGATMSAPDPVGESSGIALAAAPESSRPAAPARPGAPSGLSMAAIDVPGRGSPNAQFIPPSRPDTGARLSADARIDIERPITPSTGTRLEVATATPSVAAPSQRDVGTQTQESTGTIAARSVLEELPGATGSAETSPESPQLALADPSSLPTNAIAGPLVPRDAPAIAPEAQTAEPSAPESVAEVPQQSSGVLASLVRSNTVLGATVSAAKALLAPSDEDTRVAAAPAGDVAPRPDSSEVALLALQSQDQDAGTALAESLSVPADLDKPVRAEAPEAFEVAALSTPIETFRPRTRPALPLAEALSRRASDATDLTVEQEQAAAPATDLSAIPEVEVAALGSDVANEPVTPAATLAQPSTPVATCDIDLVLAVRVGAEVVASLSSPCRPNQTFLVDHVGLSYSVTTDADGFADFVVPAMVSNVVVRATFPDGASAVNRTTVANMSRMTRVALVWNDDMDFNLHAYEFGAGPGSEADVWQGNPMDYRSARRGGGGYLLSLGPEAGPGIRAEVYTIFETVRTDDGVVDFGIDVAASQTCNLAPSVRVMRSEGAELVRDRQISVELGDCSATTVGLGLQDIRIAKVQ